MSSSSPHEPSVCLWALTRLSRLTSIIVIGYTLCSPPAQLYADPLTGDQLTRLTPEPTPLDNTMGSSTGLSQELPEALKSTQREIEDALKRLRARAPHVKLTQRAASLSPNLLLKLNLPLEGSGGREQASSFVSEFKGLWSGVEVRVTDAQTRRHRTVAQLKGYIEGLPILNQDARLAISAEGRALRLSSALSGVYQTRSARLKESEAARLALAHLNLPLDAPYLARPGFVVHAGVASAVFEVEAGASLQQQHPVVRIDAVEGVVLSVQDRVRR